MFNNKENLINRMVELFQEKDNKFTLETTVNLYYEVKDDIRSAARTNNYHLDTVSTAGSWELRFINNDFLESEDYDYEDNGDQTYCLPNSKEADEEANY
jgi:sugar-specific transcriptional regulator TrmB